MIAETSKVLAFSQGVLRQYAAPDWFEPLLTAEDLDWQGALLSAGVTEVESFGGDGDKLSIYHAPTGFYIEYLDSFEIIAYIFISNPADYLKFRIDWIKPLVELIDQSDSSEEKRGAHR